MGPSYFAHKLLADYCWLVQDLFQVYFQLDVDQFDGLLQRIWSLLERINMSWQQVIFSVLAPQLVAACQRFAWSIPFLYFSPIVSLNTFYEALWLSGQCWTTMPDPFPLNSSQSTSQLLSLHVWNASVTFHPSFPFNGLPHISYPAVSLLKIQIDLILQKLNVLLFQMLPRMCATSLLWVKGP